MKWYEKIDDFLFEFSSVVRGLAVLILSLLLLGLAGGVIFALYKGVIYTLANRPWWLKVVGL